MEISDRKVVDLNRYPIITTAINGGNERITTMPAGYPDKFINTFFRDVKRKVYLFNITGALNDMATLVNNYPYKIIGAKTIFVREGQGVSSGSTIVYQVSVDGRTLQMLLPAQMNQVTIMVEIYYI